MLDPGILVAAGLTIVAVSGMMLIFAGLKRIPWLEAAASALGLALVVVATFLPPGSTAGGGWPILLAAIGGGIAVWGYFRGKDRRDSTIAGILQSR